MDIKNGQWTIPGLFPDFRIGSKIVYECGDDFKPIGTTQLTCLASGYWSDYAPRCLPKGLNIISFTSFNREYNMIIYYFSCIATVVESLMSSMPTLPNFLYIYIYMM